MRIRSAFCVFVVILIALFVVGCSGSDHACARDTDCADSTLVCESSRCVPRCQGVECEPGYICESSSGQCVSKTCSEDGDCGHEAFVCRDSGCEHRCEDVECDAGHACSPVSGVCEPAACVADDECQDEALECSLGRCVSKCEGKDCGESAVCHPSSGECVAFGRCLEHSHCPPSHHCLSGTCYWNFCGPPESPPCESAEDCSAEADCAATPAGSYCLARCDSNADCGGTMCVLEESSGLRGYCLPGRGQPAEYFGVCDAHGHADGRCVGPDEHATHGHRGRCYLRGSVPHLGECLSPFEIDAANPAELDNQCDGLCGLVGEGVNRCVVVCSLFAGDACPSVSADGPMECFPAYGGYGYCQPREEGAGVEGDLCDPAYYELFGECGDERPEPIPTNPCVEGAFCAEDGGHHICMRVCDVLAQDSESGCSEPEEICALTDFAPFHGVCRCTEGFVHSGEGCVPE